MLKMNRLKVVIITQGVSRVVRPLFDSKHEIVGVIESMPRGYDGGGKGWSIFGVLKKIYCFIREQDAFLSGFCKKRDVPYNVIYRSNSGEVAAWLEILKPDLIVVFSMSQLLREEILRIPRLGVINLHPSYLPSYRGANPDFWQYYDLEMNPGVTVHYLDAGEDTGDIIYQKRVCIPLGTKSPERLDKLIGEVGVCLVLEALDAISQGDAPRIPQSRESPTARARNLELKEHSQLIDWKRWPTERVWHLLRGTESWLNAVPQPSGLLAGQRWSIHEYEKMENVPGQAGRIGNYNGRKCIFTKDGIIYIGVDYDIKQAIKNLITR